MDNKENFNTVINLIARQPWVGTKVPELSHMLYEECKCANSREMLIKIINNFSYMSRQDYSEKLNALAEEVMNEDGYEDEAQIVAMAADSGPDSSQELLYNLKHIFTQKQWLSFSGVNTFGAAYKNYKKTGRKKLYIVDDFVGSGQTVISRHNELVKIFTHAQVPEFSISFKVLVSTEHGLNAVREAGINISAQLLIKKAIDGFFPEEVATEYRSLMNILEVGLSQEYEGTKLPSLGYNGAQAAYCREAANTPNSVLPIFWWPFDSKEKKRLTMLHRAMRDA
ncbi:phosphoribosyltransferase-like protein [Pseudomonas sp. GB2N2]